VVIHRIWIFLLLAMPLFALANEVEVTVQVHGERVREGEPIEAVVCITREQKLDVDDRSFRIGDQPIRAEFTHNSIESSLLILNGRRSEKRVVSSYYQIHLPGKVAGRHLLESISVAVGGKRYSSPSTTYVVYGAESSPEFRLEAIVEGGAPLYPGQKCTFIYRLYFSTPVDPTFEQLPLFLSDAFRKVGDRQLSHDYRGGMTVQEVRQEVQAVAPGTYNIEGAVIEGFPYSRDFFGNRSYEKRRVRAESSSLAIEVLPFPERGKPSFFGGAIGRYMVRTELLSSPTPRVGDKVRLRVDILGKGEWPTVHPPLIALQDEFVRDFRLSDLPPTCEEGVGRRSYILEMRPLSDRIQQIPPVGYAYFDLTTREYGVIYSQPISIAVEPAPDWHEEPQEAPVTNEIVLPLQVAPPIVHEGAADWRQRWELPPLQEIPGLFRPPVGELVPHGGGAGWSWLLPIACSLLLIEWLLSRRRLATQPIRPEPAQLILKKAQNCRNQPDRLFQLVERGLLQAIGERYDQRAETASELPNEGVMGEVRRLLLRIEEGRFSSKGELGVDEVLDEARRLFEQIAST
jgi:hypothetical protein